MGITTNPATASLSKQPLYVAANMSQIVRMEIRASIYTRLKVTSAVMGSDG